MTEGVRLLRVRAFPCSPSYSPRTRRPPEGRGTCDAPSTLCRPPSTPPLPRPRSRQECPESTRAASRSSSHVLRRLLLSIDVLGVRVDEILREIALNQARGLRLVLVAFLLVRLHAQDVPAYVERRTATRYPSGSWQ